MTIGRKSISWFFSGIASSAAALRLSAAEVRSQRNAIFSREQARQRALYPRIEKIEVSMQGIGLDGTLLIMNRGMSTPLSCARRKWSWETTRFFNRNVGPVASCNKCVPLRSDGAPREQLGPGAGGRGAVAAPPAPHPLLHPHPAHLQRQRPNARQPGRTSLRIFIYILVVQTVQELCLFASRRTGVPAPLCSARC